MFFLHCFLKSRLLDSGYLLEIIFQAWSILFLVNFSIFYTTCSTEGCQGQVPELEMSEKASKVQRKTPIRIPLKWLSWVLVQQDWYPAGFTGSPGWLIYLFMSVNHRLTPIGCDGAEKPLTHDGLRDLSAWKQNVKDFQSGLKLPHNTGQIICMCRYKKVGVILVRGRPTRTEI